MSYDLYLFPREGRPPLEWEALLAYFQGDRFSVTDHTVNYYNQDTEVYFHFTWSAGEPAPEDPNERVDPFRTAPYVYFNINFYRPHTFALEAERVLSPFVQAFDLLVDDPQSEGMGRGEYTPQGFLRGWNAGNRFAYQAFRSLSASRSGQSSETVPLSLPMARHRAFWEWNADRNEFCQELWGGGLGVDVFVPRVMFVRASGPLRSVCVFPNLIPSALPRVDWVILLRNEFPEGIPPSVDSRAALVDWEDLRAAAGDFQVIEGDEDRSLDYLLLDYENAAEVPEALAEFIRAVPALTAKLDGVSMDQILDRELLTEAGPSEISNEQ